MEGVLASRSASPACASPSSTSASSSSSVSSSSCYRSLESTPSFSFAPRLSSPLSRRSAAAARPSSSSSSSSSPSPLFVVRAGKGKRRFGPGVPQQRAAPVLPKIEDDGNPKFVVFVRDKKIPLWFPLNIVTGGSLAKLIVGAMGNDWGKKMAQGTLTRDLGKAIYKDERTIKMGAIKNHPVLKDATELEYGYKIVDMQDQKAAFTPSNVTKIPPPEELKSVVDKAKDFWEDSMSGLKESFGGIGVGNQEASKDTKSK